MARPSLPAEGEAPMGWTEEMEAPMTGSFIIVEHHVLLGAALQNYRSAEGGIKEAFKGLYQGFEVTFDSLFKKIPPCIELLALDISSSP